MPVCVMSACLHANEELGAANHSKRLYSTCWACVCRTSELILGAGRDTPPVSADKIHLLIYKPAGIPSPQQGLSAGRGLQGSSKMAVWMKQSPSEPGPTGLNKPTQKKVPNRADCGCDPSLMTKDRTEYRSFTLQIDPPPTHTQTHF